MSSDKTETNSGDAEVIAIPVLVLKSDSASGTLKLAEPYKYKVLTVTTKTEEANEESAKDKQFAYMLEIEDHADNFFEIKHKISFFLITAAVGSLGYTLNFAVGRLGEVIAFRERGACLVIGALCGILTVGTALFSMYYDMQAYRRNLRGYYERKTEDDPQWKTFRRRSTYCQRLAFAFLFLSVIYQVALFVLFLI